MPRFAVIEAAPEEEWLKLPFRLPDGRVEEARIAPVSVGTGAKLTGIALIGALEPDMELKKLGELFPEDFPPQPTEEDLYRMCVGAGEWDRLTDLLPAEKLLLVGQIAFRWQTRGRGDAADLAAWWEGKSLSAESSTTVNGSSPKSPTPKEPTGGETQTAGTTESPRLF